MIICNNPALPKRELSASLIKLGAAIGESCFQNGIYKHSDEYGTGTPILRINDFDNNGRLTSISLKRVELSPKERSQYTILENDIVINRVNSLSHIGKSMLVPAMDEYPVFESNMMRIRINDECPLVPEYVAAVLQSEPARNHFRKVAKPAVAQASINQDDVRSLAIALYPKPIQRWIAKALLAWSVALETTEQLIAAKERHYSGLIGRLINGRSKSEAWQHVSIRDIADRVQRQGDGGNYPLLTISSASGFIRQEDRFSRYMAGESAKTYTLLRAGEFSYNKGNPKRYEFGCVFQLQNYDAALVPSVYVSFRLQDSVCAAYLRHLFVADYLKPQLRALVKTGVRNNGLLNISPDEFLSTTVPLPPLDQQTEIAQVLDAADANIDLLKRQLAALRVQKRGLMQKLLTGQWRLPPLEEEHPHA